MSTPPLYHVEIKKKKLGWRAKTKQHYCSQRDKTLTIQQFAMVDRHASHTAYELEVGQVVLITQA